MTFLVFATFILGLVVVGTARGMELSEAPKESTGPSHAHRVCRLEHPMVYMLDAFFLLYSSSVILGEAQPRFVFDIGQSVGNVS